MKFITQVVAIVVAAYIAQLFFPWYSLAVAAFAMGYFFKSKANFLAGFIAIGLLWFVKAWWTDAVAASDLSARVAEILMLNNKLLLMLLTAFLGGLVGGFAALTGSLLRYERKMKYY
ncbi:hypothetical protein [Chryseolinea lacunae]|uniref:Uncharacterized protein n=1 Tax=Chryseolinea lacunae TaxID=2801331 RepID=A0ABS1KXD7_9BACT|nr:hypothetical protein [Chryseolinea lacunae]MBL0744049.1 hypothetical protein [Chryseolinea lacunae]